MAGTALAAPFVFAALLSAPPAMAACQISGLTADCTGLDTAGVGTGTENSRTVTVEPGATIAITSAVPAIWLRDSNTVINNGTITALASGAAGIAARNSNPAITNNGVITVGNNAYGIVTVDNSTSTNNGTITGGTGSYGFNVRNGNTVTNSGTITVGNTGAGIAVSNTNQIVNSGAIIAGDNNGTAGTSAAGVALNNGSTFTNSGTIVVGAFGFSVGSRGVANSNQVTNSGTLDGRIYLVSDGFNTSSNLVTNQGLVTITNAGTPPTDHQVSGSFQQTASGTLALRVGPGNFDRLLVQGNASSDRMILGGTLRAVIQSGTYLASQTYTGVVRFDPCNCGPSMQGTFAQVTTSSPFFSAAPKYNTNSVDLTLTRIPFGSVPGSTPNQSAIGNALEAGYPGSGGNAATFYQNLFNAGSAASLDQLSGQGTAAVQTTSFDTGSMFNGTMMGQGAFWFTGDSADTSGVTVSPTAYAPVQRGHEAFAALKAPQATPGRWRIWTLGFGAARSVNADATAGSAAQTQRTGGGTVGIDHQLRPDLLAGLAVGGSESNFSAAALSTSGRITGGHLGAYAVKTWNTVYTSAAVSYARFDNSTSRSITGIGPTENASGSFASDLLGARLELGWRRALTGVTLTPFVAFEPSKLWQSGYSETSTTTGGAPGILGLTFAARTTTSLPTFVGAQVDTRIVFANGGVLSPFARVSWVHEFNPDRQVSASFVTVPAASFTVQGSRAASDAAKIDAGAKLAVNDRFSVFTNLTGEFSNRGQGYAATGGIRAAF